MIDFNSKLNKTELIQRNWFEASTAEDRVASASPADKNSGHILPSVKKAAAQSNLERLIACSETFTDSQ